MKRAPDTGFLFDCSMLLILILFWIFTAEDATLMLRFGFRMRGCVCYFFILSASCCYCSAKEGFFYSLISIYCFDERIVCIYRISSIVELRTLLARRELTSADCFTAAGEFSGEESSITISFKL